MRQILMFKDIVFWRVSLNDCKCPTPLSGSNGFPSKPNPSLIYILSILSNRIAFVGGAALIRISVARGQVLFMMPIR